jgi:hypothetical protein
MELFKDTYLVKLELLTNATTSSYQSRQVRQADTALRTAVDIDGVLDKVCTSYNDIFTAFRLVLKFYHYQGTTD